MKKLLPLIAALLSACSTTPTILSSQTPQVNAAQLVQVSQFRTPLFYLEAPLYDPELKEWIPQKFLNQVQQSIEATVNYSYTDTQLQQALSTQLTSLEMQQVIDFYQSSTGQAILNAESSFKERINRNTTALSHNQAVLSATQLQPALHNIFMSSADALISRLDSYDCLAIMQIPGSHIGLNIAKRNKANFMEQQIERALAHLYDEVNEQDIATYVQFAQSPIGKKYFAARVLAMNTIGKDFGERVAEAIAPALPSCVGSFKVSS